MRGIFAVVLAALVSGCSSEVVVDATPECDAEACDGARYGIWRVDADTAFADTDDLLRHLHIYNGANGVLLHVEVTFEHHPVGNGKSCTLVAPFDAPLDIREPGAFWTDQTGVGASNLTPEICGGPGFAVSVELEPDTSCGGEAMRVQIDHDHPSSVFDVVGVASHCDCGDDDEPPFGVPNALPASCL